MIMDEHAGAGPWGRAGRIGGWDSAGENVSEPEAGRAADLASAEGSRGEDGRMEHQNLMAGPPATHLPRNAEAERLLAEGTDPAEVAARFPGYSAAWAILAERAFSDGEVVQAYAYARTGYHRGLDQLRRAGWRGHGPIPWEHEPNRGFLRSLHVLSQSAAAIGEDDEADRCAGFLRDSSAEAARQLGG
jgi:Protein of unknown function (DUF3151)